MLQIQLSISKDLTSVFNQDGNSVELSPGMKMPGMLKIFILIRINLNLPIINFI